MPDTVTDAAARAALAEDAAERLVRYAKIDTQSSEDSTSFPSTEKQWELLRLLEGELRELGLEDVELDDMGYVFATVPATVEHDVPTIGFLAHVDTAHQVTGTNVKPQRRRYEGGDIDARQRPGDLARGVRGAREPRRPRADHDRRHDPARRRRQGRRRRDHGRGLVLLAHPEIPHGRLRIGFNPDEEVGPRDRPLRHRALRRRRGLHARRLDRGGAPGRDLLGLPRRRHVRGSVDPPRRRRRASSSTRSS